MTKSRGDVVALDEALRNVGTLARGNDPVSAEFRHLFRPLTEERMQEVLGEIRAEAAACREAVARKMQRERAERECELHEKPRD
ncbi:MAG: hypothetical protein ABIG71_04470 [Candidatus Uhrbacteria bacterium]